MSSWQISCENSRSRGISGVTPGKLFIATTSRAIFGEALGEIPDGTSVGTGGGISEGIPSETSKEISHATSRGIPGETTRRFPGKTIPCGAPEEIVGGRRDKFPVKLLDELPQGQKKKFQENIYRSSSVQATLRTGSSTSIEPPRLAVVGFRVNTFKVIFETFKTRPSFTKIHI